MSRSPRPDPETEAELDEREEEQHQLVLEDDDDEPAILEVEVVDGQALVITHSIPSPLQLAAGNLIAECEQMAEQALAFPDIDDSNASEAADLNKAISKKAKAIEAQRKAAKAPVLDFGREIDRVGRAAVAPLLAAKKQMSDRLLAYQAAAMKRKREAEEKAEKQLREAQKRAARQRAQEAAATGSAPSGAQLKAPVYIAPRVHVPEPVKTGVSVRRTSELVIDDESKIPMEFGGAKLWKLDTVTLKRLLDTGVKIPGAHVVVKTRTQVR